MPYTPGTTFEERIDPRPSRQELGRDPGPFAAILAAVLVGAAYAQGGVLRLLALAVLIAVLIAPGPGGASVLRGLIGYINDKLAGG
jgi:hypothetical protein